MYFTRNIQLLLNIFGKRL